MSHDDFEKDPLDDLAATLPAGETVLWQGRPHWPTLMRQALHIDLVAAYFAALLTWRLYAALASGAALQEALRSFIISASISLLAIGVLALIAWGIGAWLGVALTGVLPFALTIGFWATATAVIAWGLVPRTGARRAAAGPTGAPESAPAEAASR